MEDFSFCPYAALGISTITQCSKAYLRSRFLKLARQVHPDKFQDPGIKEQQHKEFVRLNLAYRVLSVPKLKQIFDHHNGPLEEKWILVMNLIGQDINSCGGGNMKELTQIELALNKIGQPIQSQEHQKLYVELTHLLEKTKKLLESQLLKKSFLDQISLHICCENFRFHEEAHERDLDPIHSSSVKTVQSPGVVFQEVVPSTPSPPSETADQSPSTQSYDIEWDESPRPSPRKRQSLRFKCYVCGGRFMSKRKWTYHSKKHTFPKDCPRCNWITPDFKTYDMHIRTCRGAKF